MGQTAAAEGRRKVDFIDQEGSDVERFQQIPIGKSEVEMKRQKLHSQSVYFVTQATLASLLMLNTPNAHANAHPHSTQHPYFDPKIRLMSANLTGFTRYMSTPASLASC